MPIPLHWHTEPFLLIVLIGVGWLYALAIGPSREWLAPPKTRYPIKRAAAFYTGLVVVYLSVGSPLDQMGEDFLFSAHMVQHMLLIYAGPPLILMGMPSWLVDVLIRTESIKRWMSWLTHPASAGTFFSLSYSLWHVPVLYEAALQDRMIHILEHSCMFFPALLMWWPILSPSARVPASSRGVCILYVFLLMVAQLPVFGFLTLSQTVWYPTYAFAPRLITGFSALDDQVLGGIIMKVVSMVVSLIVAGMCFAQWYRESEGTASLETSC